MAVVATKDSAPGRVSKLPVRIRRRQRLSISVHVALTLGIGIVVPFASYVALGQAGIDVASAMSAVVIISLLVTATLIWLAGFYSLRRPDTPSWPTPWYPPASAIILSPPHDDADALARMVVRLRRDYAAPLQVIVAYSSPVTVDMQEALEQIARQDPKFLLLFSDRGTSKADALSAALARAEGEFVGILNSCHLPDRRVFSRAWMWLSNGYDAVQGRLVVSNGDASNVSSGDAVESVGPGYAGHATETFDSTSSFWMTEVLQRTRRHDEETEAFIPFLYLDRWIPVDADLIAPRVAPTSLPDLLYQRVAWAEDTFRRSLKDLRRAHGNVAIPRHRKFELVYLQLWRPFHTWLSLQIVPLVGYWFWRAGLHSGAWIVPTVGLLSLYVVHLVPGQALFAYLSADQEMRRRKRWFFSFCVRGPLFYVPFETLMHGVAQMRATLREPRWSSRGQPVARAPAAKADPIPFPVPSDAGRPPIDRGASAGRQAEEARAVRDDASSAAVPSAADVSVEPAARPAPMSDMEPVRIAQYLTSLAESLSNRLRAMEAERARCLEKIRRLETMHHEMLAWVRTLEESHQQVLDRERTLQEVHLRFVQEGTGEPMSMARVQTLRDMLRTLAENPQHVTSITAISGHAAEFEDLVAHYTRLRRVLDDLD